MEWGGGRRRGEEVWGEGIGWVGAGRAAGGGWEFNGGGIRGNGKELGLQGGGGGRNQQSSP